MRRRFGAGDWARFGLAGLSNTDIDSTAEMSVFGIFRAGVPRVEPGELMQYLAMLGSARENTLGLSPGIVTAQEAFKLP